MKYMLMMHAPGGPYQIWDWTKQDFKAHIDFMQGFNKRLKAAGEFVSVEGLTAPDQAKAVRRCPSYRVRARSQSSEGDLIAGQ
jgi:hypothetical protein